MEIGISLSSTTRMRPSDAARHLVARARAAAGAELATLSIGDGHAHADVGYIQNVPALGRLLAEWRDRPAGCLFLLPMWPPVLVAEQVGTLAAMHDGQFIVQTGIGGSPAAYAALGASTERRVARFNECVRVVDRLLAGDAVDSEMFELEGVSLGFVPERRVEWWMGTMNEAGVDRAAKFGAAWYAAPGADVDEVRALDERYRLACEQHDTSPGVMLRRDVLVLRDGRRARELADSAIARGYRGMSGEQIVVGDPATVADRFRTFGDLGVDQIVARTMGVDPAVDLETIELLGEVRQLLAL